MRSLATIALSVVLLSGCGTPEAASDQAQQEPPEVETPQEQENVPEGDGGGNLGESIDQLDVAPETDEDSYDRDAFGDYDRDAQLSQNQSEFDDCDGYYSRYDDVCHTSADDVDVDIDETVARAEAWRSGAHSWGETELDAFGGDPANLSVMTSSVNRHEKSDNDPTAWTPQTRECEYAEQWVTVKLDYELTADQAEVDALEAMAAGC
ncbi:hypothetical protein F4561_002651 [Lipingzhangella halophila]|uniref:DUF1524 domain-containing protein n=1 Tax=Lipingzhangella halophila TaxID=1783352 RepID=A0A7W7W2J4_9ACTN|nr:hypothetical protein [Lipingzhangella halophila]MBB4931831.1 hypothetical protein [Lipingzhangella halophila]